MEVRAVKFTMWATDSYSNREDYEGIVIGKICKLEFFEDDKLVMGITHVPVVESVLVAVSIQKARRRKKESGCCNCQNLSSAVTQRGARPSNLLSKQFCGFNCSLLEMNIGDDVNPLSKSLRS